MIGRSSDKYNRYSDMQDLISGEYDKDEIDHYPKLGGVEIRRPHFFKMDGFIRGHHDIIVFRGEYHYDNIVIGTNGSKKQSYIKSGSKMERVVGRFLPLKTKGGEETDFIAMRRRDGCHLYHIPSRTLSDATFPYEKIKKTSVESIFNIKGEDLQVEWIGNQFIEHDKTAVDKPKSSTKNVKTNGEEHLNQTMDMRSAYRYPLLLDRLDRRIAIINNKQDAKNFLNGNMNKQRIDIKKRKIDHLKQKYAKNRISIKEFEEEIKKEIDNTIWIESIEEDMEDVEMKSDESDEIYNQKVTENNYI